jgi:Cu-processing system permease protein
MSNLDATMALAGWELRSAVRSRWVIATALVFATGCAVITLFGLRALRDMGLGGASTAVDGLLALAVLLPPLLGLLVGAGSVSGAREQGVLALIGAQPLPRALIGLAAFLGLTGALWLTVGLGFGVASLLIVGVAGATDILPLAGLILATLVLATAAVALGVGIGVVSSSRLQATAAAVSVWFLLAFGLDLVVASLAPGLRLGPGGLLVAILANPLESARVLALLAAGPDGSTLGPFGTHLVDRVGALGATATLAAGLLAWTLVPLGVAARALRRRDILA